MFVFGIISIILSALFCLLLLVCFVGGILAMKEGDRDVPIFTVLCFFLCSVIWILDAVFLIQAY